jgi:aminoglycoside 6'-N-acetyltransferase I
VSGEPLAYAISDLDPGDEEAIRQAAELLVEGFREDWPDAWPDLDAALQEVRECLGEGGICRAAVAEGGAILGWIGARPSYGENVWELHPLVVRPDAQRRGIGHALVADLEERVGERGGYTLWLGTDDETNMTTLSGVDLYPDVLGRLAKIRNLRGHPYEFYQRLGYAIVGVMPDANGPGKPDIYMAKRLQATGIRGCSADSTRLGEPSQRNEPH